MLVVTLDPGITTGVVEAKIPWEGNADVQLMPSQHKWDHVSFDKFLKNTAPDAIIYERFEYRRGLGNAELFPRELIGIINLYGAYEDVVLFAQMPARKNEFFKKKEKIKELELWVPDLRHGMDAMRHFLYWWSFGPGFQFNKGNKLCLVEK